jgi:purine-binding chemotaxis protein CheW
MLLCRVERRLTVWPLDSVGETMRPLPVRPVPSAPAYLLGLARVRGAPIPVIHVGALLGGVVGPTSRFVTLRTGNGWVAVAVDEVVGIRDVPLDALVPLPPIVAGIADDLVEAIGTLDAELLFALRSARVLSDDAWAAATAAP